MRLPLSDIVVSDRHRRDLGDVDALAASIKEVGLLHPVVVTSAPHQLIAGERRLEAVKKLGWADVPVTVADSLETAMDLLKAERDENECRLGFSPVEAVYIGRSLRVYETMQAKARQATLNNPETASENFSEAKGRAADKVAAAVGMSRPTLSRAEAVVLAAEENPELFGPVVEALHKNRNVTSAFCAVERIKTARLAAVTETPTGRYRCIVLDPPWEGADTGDASPMGCGDPAYATMRLPEIAALPVPDLMEPDDCHVYLWATNRVLPLAFTLLDTWGIRYITMLTWCKPSVGVGRYYRNNTEHVLFGMAGTRLLARADVGTWFEADRQGKHSTKPVEFYTMVEQCSPGPRLEMFARAPREGWTVWGGEANA